MNDGLTIGGHESPPERGPYARALAQHIEDGTRWHELPERDRERLCCLYAHHYCADSFVNEATEAPLWLHVEGALALLDGEAEHRKVRLAQRASTMIQALADRAMDRCEMVVRKQYLDAWENAHASDAPDVVHPGAGR